MVGRMSHTMGWQSITTEKIDCTIVVNNWCVLREKYMTALVVGEWRIKRENPFPTK